MDPIKARNSLAPRTLWVCSSLVNSHAERMLNNERDRDLYFANQTPLISLAVQRKVGTRK